MERISTLVVQKLLDAFFTGLDVVDEARRRVDRLLGRPVQDPYEVVWPEDDAPAKPAKGNGNGESRVESAPAKPAAKAKRAPAGRPKVPDSVERLSERIKAQEHGARALDEKDELEGKRMLARLVYILGAAEAAGAGPLTGTEIAHALTFGCGIETFGTNISRAVRQGTRGLIDLRPDDDKNIKRYGLTDEGREAYAKTFAVSA